jgi:hypothetical protein
MDFPRDNRSLDEMFKKGTAPAVNEFSGEYWVDILTGPVMSFRWAGHKKRFFTLDGKRVGMNLILCNIPFGHYDVYRGVCDDFADLEVVVLDYGQKRNIFTRNMRDRVRKMADGVYLGRYCGQEKDRVVFKGYFSLIARKSEKRGKQRGEGRGE